MSVVNMPGFTADLSLHHPRVVSLDWPTEVYRTLPGGGQIQRARVLPQKTPGAALTFETTGCNLQICTLQFYADAPPTWSCTMPTNICAHPH
jgi:hypothetical protein